MIAPTRKYKPVNEYNGFLAAIKVRVPDVNQQKNSHAKTIGFLAAIDLGVLGVGTALVGLSFCQLVFPVGCLH